VKFTSNTVEHIVRSQADTLSEHKEIHRLLCDTQTHSRLHNVPPLDILLQKNSVEAVPHNFYGKYYHIFPFIAMPSNMSLSFRLIDSKGNPLTVTHPAVIKILSLGLRCATDLPQVSSSQRHLCVSCLSYSQSEIKANDFRCLVKCRSA
jgi:hypothetical protein